MTPKASQEFPWWLVVVAATGLVLFWEVLSSDVYRAVLGKLAQGVWITVLVSVVAYVAACALGLGLALMGLSHSRVLRQAARLYIEVMRGCRSSCSSSTSPSCWRRGWWTSGTSLAG